MHNESLAEAKPAPPTLSQLFLVFCGIAMSGFGGVLPFTRRTLVDTHKWMNQEEFNDAFALSQMLPGPNVVNLATVFGYRSQGVAGALAAFFGMIGPPFVIVIVLAVLYKQVEDVAILRNVLSGVSAAAVGMFAATVLKMATPLVHQRDWLPWVIVGIVFVAVGLFRFQMLLVLLVMIPLGILVFWRFRR